MYLTNILPLLKNTLKLDTNLQKQIICKYKTQEIGKIDILKPLKTYKHCTITTVNT